MPGNHETNQMSTQCIVGRSGKASGGRHVLVSVFTEADKFVLCY